MFLPFAMRLTNETASAASPTGRVLRSDAFAFVAADGETQGRFAAQSTPRASGFMTAPAKSAGGQALSAARSVGGRRWIRSTPRKSWRDESRFDEHGRDRQQTQCDSDWHED
jgi:hypothetical protein